jgi:hypothetical protein
MPPFTATTASHINCFDAGRPADGNPVIKSGAYGLESHAEMLCQHQYLTSDALPTLPILPVTVGADDHEANEAAAADPDVSLPNDYDYNTTTNPDNPNSCFTAQLFGVLPFPLRQLVSPPSFHFPIAHSRPASVNETITRQRNIANFPL